MSIRVALNILAICGAAGFSGAMITVGVTLGGYWRSLPPATFLAWFAANNHFISKSIPLTVLLRVGFAMVASFIGVFATVTGSAGTR